MNNNKKKAKTLNFELPDNCGYIRIKEAKVFEAKTWCHPNLDLICDLDLEGDVVGIEFILR